MLAHFRNISEMSVTPLRSGKSVAVNCMFEQLENADAMVVHLGHAILKISRELFSGQAEVTPPPDWNATLASIREDLKPYQMRISKTITEVSDLAEYVDRIVSGYPSLITTTAAPQGGK